MMKDMFDKRNMANGRIFHAVYSFFLYRRRRKKIEIEYKN